MSVYLLVMKTTYATGSLSIMNFPPAFCFKPAQLLMKVLQNVFQARLNATLKNVRIIFKKAILYTSTISLGTESRLSPKLVNNMSSGVPVPSLGHLFSKLE